MPRRAPATESLQRTADAAQHSPDQQRREVVGVQQGEFTLGIDGEFTGVDVAVADKPAQRVVVREPRQVAVLQLVQLVVTEDVDDVQDDLVDGEGGWCLAC